MDPSGAMAGNGRDATPGGIPMNARPIVFAAAAIAASFAVTAAGAQQAAPPPPAFAPSDLTPAGVRAMAANCAGCHGTEGRAVAGQRDLSLAGYSRESF